MSTASSLLSLSLIVLLYKVSKYVCSAPCVASEFHGKRVGGEEPGPGLTYAIFADVFRPSKLRAHTFFAAFRITIVPNLYGDGCPRGIF